MCEDLAQAVASLKEVALHLHVNDNNGDSDAHNIPGAGKIDFAPFAHALKEINYKGFVSAELGFQYTSDPDSAAATTYATLSEIFE
jgi:sugar phosphate isomerase/epimerase